ncbi:MAG: RNA polymerase sigma factor, partial [Chloroflexi bacterium]|nr:RNA polymerase sigma factor [Chloroflexota bacterium]
MTDQARLAAVTAAYLDHADDAYRLAYAILHDRDDAMEATQEGFARAFERWQGYDPDRPLRPWLHAIVARVALDQLRRRRVRRLAIPGVADAAGSGSAPREGTGDPAAGWSRRLAIEEALSALQPLSRAAVLLRHRYGYDYLEIAALLDVSVVSVGALLSR